MVPNLKPKSPRVHSIDQFRGLSILLMVLANYLASIKNIPTWLKHAPDIGLTIIDLIAPLFIFAIGLSYGLSWKRRKADYGKWKTLQHFFTRFMAMIGIGAMMTAGDIWLQVDGTTVNWGVLQAIGVAGVLTLVVIGLPSISRAVIGFCLLAAYQYMLNTHWLVDVLQSPHGGLPGSISWGGMMILATVLADFFHDPSRKIYFFPLSGLTLVIGILLANFLPVSKNRVSLSYVLISLGISALLFLFINWLIKERGFHSTLLDSWGKNPLALYIMHLLLLGILGILVFPGISGWYSSAPLWMIFLQGFGLFGVLSAVALWLEKKHILISL